MKIVSYLEEISQLKIFEEGRVSELVLGHAQLSRFGKLDTPTLIILAEHCRRLGLLPILEWDILMTQDLFQKAASLVRELPLELFAAVRVQDPGAMQFLLENFPQTSLHLNLESGNHNLEGLKRWRSHGGKQLKRMILSMEIAKDTLKQYARELDTDLEIMGLGKVLLFYSPRSLLSPLAPASRGEGEDQGWREASAVSEEGPHKGFYLVENPHGTFMFHPKNLFLLDYLPELGELGISHLRLDFRFDKNLEFLREIPPLWKDFSMDRALSLKALYGRPVFRGFFNINKTDVLFDKLKNKNLERQDETQWPFLGEVIEVVKGKYMALSLKNPDHEIEKGRRLQVKNPHGILIDVEVADLRDSHGRNLNKACGPAVVFLNYAKGVSVKSKVYGNLGEEEVNK